MDLRLLRYFVATAEAGSATAAAESLHVTQPVLSRQLRQLENHLGLVLFERDGRRLRLSRAGTAFLPEARKLLHQADETAHAATDLAAGVVTEFQMAAPGTTVTDVIVPFIATLDRHDPLPTVVEFDGGGAEAALAGGADLAIVTTPPPQHLCSRPIATLPIWAYVCELDVWASRASVSVTELATRTLILPTTKFQPRVLLDAAMNVAGVGYGDVIEVSNTQVAQAIAATRRGIAVVSDDARFDLVPLPIHTTGGLLQIRLYAAWAPDHHAARTLDYLATQLAAFCRYRYGPGA